MNCELHYNFFGPHAGILFGKYDLLEKLFAYKVRPATNELPGKFETGTQNHEGIADVLGAVEYFEWIGKEFGADSKALTNYSGRRLELKKAMNAIHAQELEVSEPCASFRPTIGSRINRLRSHRCESPRRARGDLFIPFKEFASAQCRRETCETKHLYVRWKLLRHQCHRAAGTRGYMVFSRSIDKK